MKYYKTITKQTLVHLGVTKPYRGIEYIVSSMWYIAKHEDDFTPITKILYPAVAKIHNVSRESIESGIRDIIDLIWSNETHAEYRHLVFPDLDKKPTNSEFLLALYQYINKINSTTSDITFHCPLAGGKCQFSEEMITRIINYLEKMK